MKNDVNENQFGKKTHKMLNTYSGRRSVGDVFWIVKSFLVQQAIQLRFFFKFKVTLMQIDYFLSVRLSDLEFI